MVVGQLFKNMSSSTLKIRIPVWNGLSAKDRIANFSIRESKYRGVFYQSSKKIINYFDSYNHMTPLNNSNYINGLRKKKVKYIINNKKNVKNCLEIGGGDAFNANFLKFTKYIIIDPFVKNEERNNIKLIKNYFEDYNFEGTTFDTIILFSVLEHCKDPIKILKKAKDLLKISGNMYLYFPIINNQFAIGDVNALLHEHTYYFTLEGIVRIFNSLGLSIKYFKFQNDGTFFHLINSNKKKLLSNNKKIIKCKKFNEYKNIFYLRIKRFIYLLKTNNKILFYGATNGLNILFFLAKNKIHINYKNLAITDSDKTKWGKYISSFPKKIVNNSKKNIDKYKIVYISALSFKNEILRNKYLKNKNIIFI
jgi:SAM-dependent methyltransferase